MAQPTRLTEGPLMPTLTRYALPFFLGNLLQALYGAADLLIVGRFCDASAVAAVATGSQVMQTITGLCIGLTTGGTVLIGQAYGARNLRAVSATISTIIWLFGLLSVAITIGVLGNLAAICRLMHVPPEAWQGTLEYLFICALGVVFIVGYNATSGVLRGLGNSRTPFLFVGVACLANIAGDLFLVGRWGLGARGAALATIGAQAVSLALLLLYLLHQGAVGKFRRAGFVLALAPARQLLGYGLPIALQEGLVNISFLIITGIVNTLGVYAAAALGVVEKLIIFSMLPTTAFASALAAMTAQHVGAGLFKRAFQALYGGVGLALIFGCACFVAAQVWPERLLRLFTADARVIDQGVKYLSSYSLDCILVCFVFCMNSFFSGSGHVLFPLLHSLLSTFLLRVPVSYLLAATGNLFAIGLAAPLATAASLLLCLAYLRYLKRRALPGRF